MTPSVARRIAVLVLVAGCSRANTPMPSTLIRPAPPPPPDWRAPAPTVALAATGLRVALLRQPGLALVHLAAVIKAGSALDGDREGLAGAVATMLVEGGAGVRSGLELTEAFETLGEELRVTCDSDSVLLGMATREPDLERALALLSDVLMRPRFDDDAWRGVRARLIAELAKERDEPDKVAERVFYRALYGDHPYGHTALGSAAALGRTAAADLRAFYAAHYGPPATTLVVVGDFGDEVQGQIASAFESWSGGPAQRSPPPPPPPPPPRSPSLRVVIVDRPGASQSQLCAGGLGVARASPDFPSSAALEMVLGGSFTSRLNQNLREKHGYTYAVSAEFVARVARGPFTITSAVRSEATAAAIGEILVELRRLGEPMSRGELDKARALVTGQIIDGFSDGTGAAQLIADAVGHGVDADAWSRLPSELAALDPARVARDAARLLDPEHVTIVVVGDRSSIESSIRARLPIGATVELRGESGELLSAIVPAPSRPR